MNDEQLQQENAELKARLSNLESRSQNPTPGSSAPRSQSSAPGLSTPAPDFVTGAASDEIDLRELWATIWQGKWIIVAITTIFTVGAVVVPLDADQIDQIVLWRDMSQIFYQIALGAAAVGSL